MAPLGDKGGIKVKAKSKGLPGKKLRSLHDQLNVTTSHIAPEEMGSFVSLRPFLCPQKTTELLQHK